MAKSSRSFTLATQAAVDEEKSQYEPIDYVFTDPDAKPEKGKRAPVTRTCTAHYPGEGAMVVMAASVGMSDTELMNPAGSLFSFLAQAFSPEDYKFIRKQVSLSRLDLRGDVLEMVGDMAETWSGVPTGQ
jgi:hypothetical protein